VLVVQGGADQLVLKGLTDAWVTKACGAGDVVDYRVFDGADHVSVITAAKSDVLAWLAARADGHATRSTC
jgi:hypothetical protein